MQSFACRAAWVSPHTSRFSAFRVIAGCRFPRATRSFRSSSHTRSPNDDPADAAKPSWNRIKDLLGRPTAKDIPNLKPDEVVDSTNAAAGLPREAEEKALPAAVEGVQEKSTKRKDRGDYGSALRRAGRNVKNVKELPAVTLPAWFLERNVLLFKDGTFPGVRHLGPYDPEKHEPKADKSPEGDVAQSRAGKRSSESHSSPANPTAPETTNPLANSDYYIHKSVMVEIGTAVSAGLHLPMARYADSHAASKPHLLLQCPKDGGIVFLDTVVQFAAALNEADVVSLDAQDIAEVAGEYAGDLPDCPVDSIRSLGYDTHLMMAHRDQPNISEEMTEERDDDETEDDVSRRLPGPYPQAKVTVMPTITFVGSEKISELFNSGQMNKPLTLSDRPSTTVTQNASRFSPNPDPSNNARVDLLLEAFLDAAHAKRRVHQTPGHSTTAEGDNSGSLPSPGTQANKRDEGSHGGKKSSPRPLIILIRDYAEMNATATGGPVLDRLFEIVGRRRKEGQRVLIIGTTSSQDLIPSLSKSGFKSLQSEPGQGPCRVIVTPCEPASASAPGGALERCYKGRIFRINIRHLQDMIRRLASSQQRVSDIVSQPAFRIELDSTTIFISGLEEEIWSFDRVHRAAMTILGLLKEDEELRTRLIMSALRMLDASDNAKFDWIRRRKEDEKNLAATGANDLTQQLDAKVRGQKDVEDRIKKLHKFCNSHEKKLLNGVVDAANIRTTFADVQATPETVEALKTLTSLSLLRPEAFTYGVLATDKIPGLLLYGPPGTGKTLLAKAVAKESGATVLEVSGSNIYDKYVGESEKNVRAIFSLARKLTPCIVFIDEADAIFATRDSLHKRTSHREIINQFLREWDGMDDGSAFIMVATNRPYDLDDAVLRRLPRRLLVDLPNEQDREAILRIHLQGELLDASVSLTDLASQTPFYSGSDLKNLLVAAALICVREENDAAKAHTGPTPYEHAPKRTLTLRHFEKAMDEISASISEDMSSLSAIRKFDEKYGDRKGRRKKSAGYGFGTKTEAEKNNTDLVRVRA